MQPSLNRMVHVLELSSHNHATYIKFSYQDMPFIRNNRTRTIIEDFMAPS